MDKKSKGSFSKVRKLITVLQKCNGKAVIGDSNALISPRAAKILVSCGLLVLMGALFLGMYYVQPHVDWLITGRGLSQGLMLAFLVLSFVLAVKDIVTVLYTSDDLELLLPMPFSANQIVVAKLAVVSVFPVTLSFIVLNAVCLGFGIREGAGISFCIGIVLSSVLIPVTGIFAATMLVVILFRLVGFIRNRDITVALGGIFTFGLTIAYIFINSKLRQGGTGETAAAAVNTFSAISMAFPNIFFMSRFMFEGSISGLLISIAFSAVIIILAMLAVKALYLNTALSMTNTGTGKKDVSKALLHSSKKSDTLKALTAYETKSSRRNPAYMIYGFVMSFVWPLLFALPFAFENDSILSGITFPLSTTAALLGFMSFAITASCFSCGFNVLPGSAFSREGSTFWSIRALPVDMQDYYKSKRNFSMLICSLGSVLYVIILGIVCLAAGIIPIKSSWTILAGAFVSFLLNLTFINLMLWRNSAKPRLNWDSETEISRKLGLINLIALILGIAMLSVCLVSLVAAPALNTPKITRYIVIICAATALGILAVAIVVNTLAVKAAAKNLMKLEG